MSNEAEPSFLEQALESLSWVAGAPVAVGSGPADPIVHCAPGRDRGEAQRLAERLRELEPLDPFSPRRAEACGAAVLSAADAGGAGAYGGSLHGRRLRRLGYGAPLVVYLRRAGRIAAGCTLLRDWDAPPFDATTVRVVRQLHPLLEQAAALRGARPPQVVAAELTVREAEVARLVAGGAPNADIAEALTISESTVKSHLTRVYAKLGVRSRTQLAVVMSDDA
jgi:DNA-binding CsgD family transcriptional regulator